PGPITGALQVRRSRHANRLLSGRSTDVGRCLGTELGADGLTAPSRAHRKGSMTTRHMTDCDVIILCGGLGTRLKSVLSDRPKAMANIHGRPFLSFLLDHWFRHCARRFIFCTGYMGDYIEAWVRSAGDSYE